MKEYIVSRDTEYEFEMGRFEELQELVRCKDCKYSFQGWHNLLCERPFHEFEIKPDGFCAWAKRRKEE